VLLKVARKFIGKTVVVVWKDPSEGGYAKIPEGTEGLSTWTEMGYLKEIKKGVMVLIRGVCWNPENASIHEYSTNHIPMSLIDEVTTDLKKFEEYL